MAGIRRCHAGHEVTHDPNRRGCPACRRNAVVELVAATDASLPRSAVEAAVDAVTASPAVLRSLAAALSADPAALSYGAPPVVGRVVTELVARGSTTFVDPACVACTRTGRPLIPYRGSLVKCVDVLLVDEVEEGQL